MVVSSLILLVFSNEVIGSVDFQDAGHDFKTPRVDGVASPKSSALPIVETESGEAKPAQDLMYTVSFYRKQRPGCSVNVTPHAKIVRNQSAAAISSEEEEEETKVCIHLALVSLCNYVEVF